MKIPEHIYIIDIDNTASESFLKGQLECCIEFENYKRAAQLKKVIQKRFHPSNNNEKL